MNRLSFLKTLAGSTLGLPLLARSLLPANPTTPIQPPPVPTTDSGPNIPALQDRAWLASDGTRHVARLISWAPCRHRDHRGFAVFKRHYFGGLWNLVMEFRDSCHPYAFDVDVTTVEPGQYQIYSVRDRETVLHEEIDLGRIAADA